MVEEFITKFDFDAPSLDAIKEQLALISSMTCAFAQDYPSEQVQQVKIKMIEAGLWLDLIGENHCAMGTMSMPQEVGGTDNAN